MDSQDFIFLVFVSVFVLFLIGVAFASERIDIQLSQESANAICYNITGDINVVALETEPEKCDFWGNCDLVCEIPSYDSTQHIIVRSNSDRR